MTNLKDDENEPIVEEGVWDAKYTEFELLEMTTDEKYSASRQLLPVLAPKFYAKYRLMAR